MRESPHQLPANEHPIPRKYPSTSLRLVPLPLRQGRVWEVRTAGRCRHRPLRNSIENPCVGADAYIGPVAPIFKSYVGRRALTPPRWRSGYRTAGWGQPALQCLAPLPKGGLGGRIATASVRTDLAMTGFPWSVVHGRRATARVAPTEGYKECLAGGRTGASAPTDMWKRLRRAGLQEVR